MSRYKFNYLHLPRTAEEADILGLLPTIMYCPAHPTVPMKLYGDRAHSRFRCTKNRCNKSISGAKYSFFSDAKLETHVALTIMLCFSWNESYEKTTSLVTAMRQSSGGRAENSTLGPNTTVAWFRYCREMVIDHFSSMMESLPQIGGPGVIVQIDESLFEQQLK